MPNYKFNHLSLRKGSISGILSLQILHLNLNLDKLHECSLKYLCILEKKVFETCQQGSGEFY
jgi:hypothetical protein